MSGAEKEYWERIDEGRCPICLAKGPFTAGAIPVVVCECGNCRCEGCIDTRQLERDGLPPRGEKTQGGIIVPPKEETPPVTAQQAVDRIKVHLADFQKWKNEEQRVVVDEHNMVHPSPELPRQQGRTLFKIAKEVASVVR